MHQEQKPPCDGYEYCRLPLVFLWPGMSDQTVISCFLKLLSILVVHFSVHSQRETQFMPREVLRVVMTYSSVRKTPQEVIARKRWQKMAKKKIHWK